jgi:hypothetical protein
MNSWRSFMLESSLTPTAAWEYFSLQGIHLPGSFGTRCSLALIWLLPSSQSLSFLAQART